MMCAFNVSVSKLSLVAVVIEWDGRLDPDELFAVEDHDSVLRAVCKAELQVKVGTSTCSRPFSLDCVAHTEVRCVRTRSTARHPSWPSSPSR